MEVFEQLLSGYSEDVVNLFNKLRALLHDSVDVQLEEKVWAKLPSFYYQDKFVRFIPFKKHINIEAKAIKADKPDLSNYTITPTGMLKIETKQDIPTEYLERIFRKTLLGNIIPISQQLQDPIYAGWSADERDFVKCFNDGLEAIGYTCKNEIVDGICYGKLMMIYRKQNAKSDKVYARIYFRANGIVLRLFLNNVSKHSDYIVNCSDFIKETFTGEYAKCNYCRGEDCKFRKSYIIDGATYEKCNGLTFEFFSPSVQRTEEYIKLFKEFYR